ncbi:MAG TPA: adventurous gliding motility protein CglF [Archangium sp.]|uniref:adventurous gliding motility protein CglF n=1 Tax=Archangium sp. TaxID=1872627 RepID=UPI002ED84CCF
MRNLLMLCAVLAVGPAFAQDEDSSSGGGGGARAAGGGGGKAKAGPQTIDFEDDTIEGDLTKPDGEYVEARSKVQHSNLIRIREDFEDKVMQSVGEL